MHGERQSDRQLGDRRGAYTENDRQRGGSCTKKDKSDRQLGDRRGAYTENDRLRGGSCTGGLTQRLTNRQRGGSCTEKTDTEKDRQSDRQLAERGA